MSYHNLQKQAHTHDDMDSGSLINKWPLKAPKKLGITEVDMALQPIVDEERCTGMMLATHDRNK